MANISVIVIDDHPLFRQGVVDAISLEPDIVVVAQSSDGEEGVKLIKKYQPTVAIVDVNLPGINGHQVAKQIQLEKSPTGIILLTAYDDEEQRVHAFRAGAAAYCVKDVQPEQLVKIIRSVADGKFVVNEIILDGISLEKWLISQTDNNGANWNDPGEPFQSLSIREMEVLTFITQGKSNKEIAVSLGISHQTVKNHVTAILRKLKVGDRTQAAIYALRRGWVKLHQPIEETQEKL
jgi:two-component system response regulator DegU